MFLNSTEFKQFASDQEVADSALMMMAEIVDSLDAQQKSLENIHQCLAIQHSLHGLKYPVVDRANRRKYEGFFVFIEHEQRKGTHYERQFYVFNDIFIITNLQKRFKFILDVKQIDVKFSYF